MATSLQLVPFQAQVSFRLLDPFQPPKKSDWPVAASYVEAAKPRLPGTVAGEAWNQLMFEKVNWSAPDVALVPPVVVTVTLTVPALSAGDVAVQVVVEEHVAAVPAVVPKVTVAAPTTNPEPVIVTDVPPAVEPEVGLTAVTLGEIANAGVANTTTAAITIAVAASNLTSVSVNLRS